MSGMKQTLQAQAVNAHNLANISTPGFRADLQTFTALQVEGTGYSSRSYSSIGVSGVDLRSAAIKSTGNDLDIAIESDGFLAIQSSDGKEGYTRAGNLHINGNGLLVDSRGRSVLGNGGPISLPPASKIEIGDDGTISIVSLGSSSSTLAVVDRLKLVNPENQELFKGEDGLLYLVNNGIAEADSGVRVIKGALESSNVNVIEGLINMISLARSYEMQTKLMKTAKENDQKSSSILSLN